MTTIKQVLNDAELLVQKLKEADELAVRLTNGVNQKIGVEGLTPMETKVYDLISEGKDRHEIASELKISAKTVDVHRDHIRRKMGLKRTRDLYHKIRK